MTNDPYRTSEAYQCWKAAWLHFYPEGKGKLKPNPKGWVLHHKDQSLRHTDIKRYNEWRIEDVVPMTNEEHTRLHNTGNHYQLGYKHSAESRAKMSASMKGRKAWNKGIHPSDETRKKMSEAKKGSPSPRKGKHLSAEAKAKLSECMRKSHWWNNGESTLFVQECPGPDWKLGRINYHRKSKG